MASVGRHQGHPSGLPRAHRLCGGLHDRDLGFVLFDWRDYVPFTGRWPAPDPIGDRGGDPDWYCYCLDDPVNNEDVTGLNPLAAWAPYIPAFNSIGKWAAENTMDGSPGPLDLVVTGAKAYGQYVKNNAKKIKKGNKDYYDKLYGRNNQPNDSGTNGKKSSDSKSKKDTPSTAHKETDDLWRR